MIISARITGAYGKLLLLLVLGSLLSACGGFRIWPFGGDNADARSRGPGGSTEYRCDKGRKFYVKLENAGKAAWLILPDREVLLNRTDAGSYSNGITTLVLEGEAARLDDGYKHDYQHCQATLPAKK